MTPALHYYFTMKFSQILTNILFPRRCAGCSKKLGSGVVCNGCFGRIPVNKTLFCGVCNARLPGTSKICHPKSPALFGAAGFYDEPTIKALIHNLKFRNMREAAQPLAELVEKFLTTSDVVRMTTLDVVIPVPLSRERLLARGYNQAELIAERLAEKISLPLAADLLIKIRHSKPQSETKDIYERRANLAGCFHVPNPVAVAGRRILLVDDVTTSGTTFMEAAGALKKAGARRIIAVAAAKA